MTKITKIIGREILDSRGNPTIECDVFLKSGKIGRSSVPSGASTGNMEAIEIRDNNKDRYNGKGVLNAVNNINKIISKYIIGKNALNQTNLDKILIELDGTENKSKLGSNAILAVSIAIAKAASKSLKLPLYRYIGGSYSMNLPVPMINIINGGVHSNNNLDFQEFMIVPVNFYTFKEAIRCGSEIFHSLKNILTKKNISTAVGDEGGFAPNFKNNSQCLSTILQAIEKTKYHIGEDVFIALDCASSEIYDGKYNLNGENLKLSSEEFTDYLYELTNKFPIISIEDGMDENDLYGWKLLTKKLGKKIQLVGDDLFATNTKLLKKGIKNKIANSILIKMNQIGTLTETLSAIEMAKRFRYTTIISHRSGETEESIISDISVGTNANQIKTGSLSRGERISKYNQLLRIEEKIGNTSNYIGRNAFHNIFQI